MSASQMIGNRNSTPESSASNLRPPSARAPMAAGHQLRASADMGAFSATHQSTRGNRPASEVIYNQMQRGQNRGSSQEEAMDQDTQQWIADIDQYETTLDEMAAATLDQDFKDELSAIEQWFRVLSEAERTAALYALLQQTTQVQIKFFIGVLQQMSQKHPMSGVLSPANFGEKDPMSSRLSSAMNNRFGTDANRNSAGLNRPPQTPATKRNSGLDPDEINSMFPDAAAAIAKQKEAFTQQTGTAPTSNRNSAAIGERSSLVAPLISAPREEGKKEGISQVPPSPWRQRSTDLTSGRPKSSSGQQPMGQFSQPAPPAGLRSPRNLPISGDSNIQNTTLNAPEGNLAGLPMLSPYPPGASWASMTNTPMVPNFSHQQPGSQADMVANATAMKLAALETVNTRFQLDDVRKYRSDRRARSTEGEKTASSQQMAGHGPLRNEIGQVLSPQQAALMQAQQLAAMNGGRSRPTSPSQGFQAGFGGPGLNMAPQSNGFLSVYDANTGMMNNGMSGLTLGQFGVPVGEGYHSDASEINRGRSPRGRRGTSKPPEDPTDIELLKDIPAWLRSLRLHKYTDNLKDMDWHDLVQLDDAGLEKRGVNALGARRKMTKVFEQVREAQAQGKL